MPRRRPLTAALLLIAAGPLAACSGTAASTTSVATPPATSSATPAPASAPTTPATPSRVTSPARTSTPTPDPSPSTAASPAARPTATVDVSAHAATGGAGRGTYWVSPSGNLRCGIVADGPLRAGCQAAIPVAGSQCGENPAWKAAMVVLDDTGAGRADCTTQGLWITDPPARVLPYGSTITVGQYSCTSAETGMTCRDAKSGGWFSLAREGAKVG